MPAPSSTPTDAVRADGVSRSFAGGIRALDGVRFALSAGTLTALIGGNGSGKSTLLKLIHGALVADSGELRVMGLDPRRDRAALRPLTGYAGQDVALDPEMTGWETLRLFHALRGLPRSERDGCLGRVVDEAGLEPFVQRRVGTWSGGERQRLHLGLEMMHGPRLLLLDEPTTSLDPRGRAELWRRLAAWRDEGNTVIVATHDLADAGAHCDRVLLLHSGRLVADGSPAELVAAHARARVAVTFERPASEADVAGLRESIAALPEVADASVDASGVTLWRANHSPIEPLLHLLEARGIAFRGLVRDEPDLAAAYFRLTGSAPGSPPRPGRGGGRGGGGGGGRGGGRRG
ncbi:ABC transporter ATP-binding protein [Longimicrobium sp.]|jgi:ABC-2 type transport system ATP-binding protein|uniref:ABC transporter ATP-binding protein n=1 Tax=Longimicrobium sp. TaxID=2029185 RepID=UPI002ED83C48